MHYIERAKRVLKFVEKYKAENKYCPTIREIAENQEASIQAIHLVVGKMRYDKFIKPADRFKQRQLNITAKGKNLIN